MASTKMLHRFVPSLRCAARSFSTQIEKSSGITSKKVEVNGAEIHYDQTGIGRHPVLLLPGALGSSRTDFGVQLETLDKERFTWIAWDPRGYGKSIPPERDWPEDFFRRDAEDAAQLMQNLGFSSYSLIGWSDGANTSILVAAKYPDRIRKLVMFGGNAYITKEDLEMYEAVKNIDSWSERMRKPFIELYGEEYFRRHWTLWCETIMKYYKNRPDGDVCKKEAQQVSCPTLIIHGQKDAMVPQFHAEYFHSVIRDSRLHYMPDGKHNLHFKYAKEFNTLVQDFLNET